MVMVIANPGLTKTSQAYVSIYQIVKLSGNAEALIISFLTHYSMRSFCR